MAPVVVSISSPTSSSHRLQHLHIQPTSLSLLPRFLSFIPISNRPKLPLQTIGTPFYTTPLPKSESSSFHAPFSSLQEEGDDELEESQFDSLFPEEGVDEFEAEDEEFDNLEEEYAVRNVDRAIDLPSLTVKERKDLAYFAHGLGDKLSCQIVGKSGVTDTAISCFIENLEKNELLKIKVLKTCPGELEDVVKLLEEATGSLIVDQIGRSVIVYKPSIAKMKEEERKREARRVYVRKDSEWKPTLMEKVQGVRSYGRDRRGSYGHDRRGSYGRDRRGRNEF